MLEASFKIEAPRRDVLLEHREDSFVREGIAGTRSNTKDDPLAELIEKGERFRGEVANGVEVDLKALIPHCLTY